MHRFVVLFVCGVGLFALTAQAQARSFEVSSNIAPLRIPAGTIVDFQLQTRLKSTAADVLDLLPKGSLLRVKLIDSIDSTADRDGSAFRGLIVSSVAWGNHVVIHPDAEVHGLFALLRSAAHPEGFQYQLLVTGLVDHGQSYTLTAFLDRESSGAAKSSPQSNSLE